MNQRPWFSDWIFASPESQTALIVHGFGVIWWEIVLDQPSRPIEHVPCVSDPTRIPLLRNLSLIFLYGVTFEHHGKAFPFKKRQVVLGFC